MKRWTHIKIRCGTKEKLKNIQMLQGETYDQVLKRLFERELSELHLDMGF